MNDRPQDPELRALFEAQKRDDAEHAPSFAAMIVRARAEASTAADPSARPEAQATAKPAGRHTHGRHTHGRHTHWRHTHWRRYSTGALAAAALAALIFVPRMRSGDDAFEQAVRAFQSDPALGAWQSPTDGLLNLPGDRLLSTIPTLGTGPQ